MADFVLLGGDVLVVDYGGRSAANGLVAGRLGPQAVIRVFKVSEKVLAKQTDLVYDFPFDIGAGEDDALDFGIIRILVQVRFVRCHLLAPIRPDRHPGAQMLQKPVGPHKAAADHSDIGLFVSRFLHFREPVALLLQDLRVIIEKQNVGIGRS